MNSIEIMRPCMLDRLDSIKPLESMFTFNEADLSISCPKVEMDVKVYDYIPMFSIERELRKNANLIKNNKITCSMDYSVRTSLLLERVDLYKVKDIVDSLESIKIKLKEGK